MKMLGLWFALSGGLVLQAGSASAATPAAAAAPQKPAAAPAKGATVGTTALPGKTEMTGIFKKLRPKDKMHASLVLADIGGGRYPVLVRKRTKACVTMHDDSESCDKTSIPALVLARRAAAGNWSVDEVLELPSRDTPYYESLEWGQTTVKDWDQDGRQELLVIYKYRGEPVPAMSDGVEYRDLCILNLEPKLSIAFHTSLSRFDDNAENEDGPVSQAAGFKMRPRPTGGAPDIVLTTEVEAKSQSGHKKAAPKRVKQEKVIPYDPKADAWVDPDAPKEQ